MYFLVNTIILFMRRRFARFLSVSSSRYISHLLPYPSSFHIHPLSLPISTSPLSIRLFTYVFILYTLRLKQFLFSDSKLIFRRKDGSFWCSPLFWSSAFRVRKLKKELIFKCQVKLNLVSIFQNMGSRIINTLKNRLRRGTLLRV